MRFSDFWKSFNNPEERKSRIKMAVKEIDAEIMKGVDPTRWRKLLDQRKSFEEEWQMITGAPLRME